MHGNLEYRPKEPTDKELEFAAKLRKRAVTRYPRIIYATTTQKVVREMRQEMNRLGLNDTQLAERSRVSSDAIRTMLDGGNVSATVAMTVLRSLELDPTTLPWGYFRAVR